MTASHRPRSRLRRGGALATVAALSLTMMSAVGAANAATLPVVDDFEAPLLTGAATATGIPLGFYAAADPSSTTTFERSTTPPTPVPGAPAGNAVLRSDFNVVSWGVVVHAFADATATQWVTQNWSPYEGFQFELYGSGSGTSLFVDVIDNRPAGSTTDNAERWTAAFTDDVAGWRTVKIPFDSMTRKDIGNGAPNDGFDLTEVHGWAFGAITTFGPRTYYLDDVALYGESTRPLTVGFSDRNFDIPEGGTGEITVKLRGPWRDVNGDSVTVDYTTEPGTAVPGRDFTPVSGTLTFTEGGPREQTFSVATFDNAKDDGDRRVLLRLSNPTGVEPSILMQAAATILDDEPFDPLLLDDFERAPDLWDAKDSVLTNPEIAVGDQDALPGQGAWERVLNATVATRVDIQVQGRVCNQGNGVIPVYLLSTPTFDATTVDHTTVRLGDASESRVNKKTGVVQRQERDVNRDRLTDLVFQFRFKDTGLECDPEVLPLSGETFDGRPITNQPAVRFGRDFALGQDWSAAQDLTFWYQGTGSGNEVTVEVLDNRAPDPGRDGWDLVWSDEFDGAAGTAPNPDNWGFEIGDGTLNGIPGWGNDERQYYTDNTDNASLDGRGNLVITMREADGELCYYGACDYTSARLLTKHKAEFAYGRIDARIEVPAGGPGLWPAFWSLGTDIDQVGWPQTGEIDFMEYVSRLPNEVYGTIHGPGYSGGQSFGDRITVEGGVPGAFRTTSVVWEPDRITWYLDGQQYHQASPADVAPNEWVFNHPFFLLLNMAIGGNFGGAIDPGLEFPRETKIDYVRVYQGPDTAERFETSSVDNFTGWKQVSVPLKDLKRSADAYQPKGAPNDGLDLTEVWGYGFRVESGSGDLRIDQVRLVPLPPPTDIQVTTLADSGPGSLRAALAAIAPDGTITFDPALAGGTIALTSGPLRATRSVTVNGSGAPGLAVDGRGTVRVLEVAAAAVVAVNDLTLTNGYGFDLGGAVINNGSLTLERVVVSDSRVTTAGVEFWKGGAGIYTGENGVLVLRDSTVRDNEVVGGAGGGVYGFFGSDVTIERSTISGNSSNDVGGGVRSLGDTVITNSTISGNTATGWHGGGVFHTDGAMTISYSTVTANTAPDGRAGGLFLGTFGATASAALESTIVSGNSGDECIIFYGGPFTMQSLGFNVLQDGTCGTPAATDQVGVDALLGPLADNGGPTLTHMLLDGSPAIDTANPAAYPATDQRGITRPQGAGPDVGAVER